MKTILALCLLIISTSFLQAKVQAKSFDYRPNTIINTYKVDLLLDKTGKLFVTEHISVTPRNLCKICPIDNPMLDLIIPASLHSKQAIRSINQNISGIQVLLNNKRGAWKEDYFENTDGKELRIRLLSKYATDSAYNLRGKPNKLHFTIQYTVNKTVTKADSSNTAPLDAISWKLLHHKRHIKVKNVSVNLQLPKVLPKRKLAKVALTYTSDNQHLEWTSPVNLHAEINNLKSGKNDLTLSLVFPPDLLEQTAQQNFNLVLDKNASDKGTLSFLYDKFLLYWQFPFFILYFIFLYYYARHNGSLGAMGTIVVQYKAPDNMSLLQSGLLLDQENNQEDLEAAIIELASLGFLKIVSSPKNKQRYLKRLKKSNQQQALTPDQDYLLNEVLFKRQAVIGIKDINKSGFTQKINHLNQILFSSLQQEDYFYKDPLRSRLAYLIKAILTAIPILLFSLYVSYDLYGENLMIWSLAGSGFLTVILFIIYQRGIWVGLPFLIVLLVIIGYGFTSSHTPQRMLVSLPMMIMPLIFLTIWFFYQKIDIYTGKGLMAYKKLIGFKQFVERVEKKKLSVLLKENPNHLEHNLAFALLFNVLRRIKGKIVPIP